MPPVPSFCLFAALLLQVVFAVAILVLNTATTNYAASITDFVIFVNATTSTTGHNQQAVLRSTTVRSVKKPKRCTDPQLVCDQIAKWRKKYAGPPDTISIADRVDCLLEAVDQQGRYWRCLGLYFEAYRNEMPFSNETFFYWLDTGSGREFDVKIDRRNKKEKRCGRGTGRYSLNARHMYYFSAEERSELAVRFEFAKDYSGGNSVRVVSNKTGAPLPAGKLLFVWTMEKVVYVASEKKGVVAHTSFGGALPVLHAGEFIIGRYGKLAEVRPQSGHYRPSVQHVDRFRGWIEHELGRRDVDLTSIVSWKGMEEDWDTQLTNTVGSKI